MSWAENAIKRGQNKPRHEIVIESHGDEIRFVLPYTGPERATFRRQRQEFIELNTSIVNQSWVKEGLLPEGGYQEDELGMVFDLHYMSKEPLSQAQVLEMFRDNPEEVQAVYLKLAEHIAKSLGEAQRAEIDEKKASSVN